VILGVMIAITLELCGISSLAFAVGVYLPLSASAPILAGGLVRKLVDRHLADKLAARKLSQAELAAESDKSPGVLLASGYIAGGAIAGIVIALASVFLRPFMQRMSQWAETHNPFYSGAYADALSLIPFVCLAVLLYLAGRGLFLSGEKAQPNGTPSPP